MQYTDITSRALTYLLRSPHLHIDMTEAIYRGLAEICCAQPDGVLLRLRAPWNGRPFLYECSAATPERSAALLEQLGSELARAVLALDAGNHGTGRTSGR